MGENFGKCNGYRGSVICNAELCPNYFSVNVSILAVVFHRQISENQQFCLKLLVFLEIVGEIRQLVSKRLQKD